MTRIVVGVCDSNIVFETGVLACLADDPTIEARRIDPENGVAEPLAVAVTSVDHIDDDWVDCPIVVCADGSEENRDLVGRNDVGALLSRATVTPDQLVGAVHAVGAGLRLTQESNGLAELDQRSLAVLRLLADGASTRDIASELGYSERTVKAVIATIASRLGSRTRAHAVATALRRSLIS